MSITGTLKQVKHEDRIHTEADATNPTILVHHLSKAFGTLFALKNVNLKIHRGEFLAIFGPNGAGKTTLIRILATLTRPTSGEIFINGYSLNSDSEKIRRQIGVIAHQTYLYDELTAEENLRFYGKMYDVKDLNAKIARIIAEVGLGLRRRDRVRTFSRGMQQRLSIARAMIHDPSILLLDEPYTGLDQHASEMLTEWLKELKSKDRTILMVTHDLDRGIDLADRVAIIHQGKLVFEEERSNIEAKTFREKYYHFVS
ncbi:MAG: heme ABC exporter ATP-binding protein CcmA [Calditrichaeota bacterium]|nr:MAG: heme ABC exporter ATP-binding protein CcmA [Calditrichota bacterium]